MHLDQAGVHVPVAVRGRGEAGLDVGAGGEGASAARYEQDPHVVVGGDLRRSRPQLLRELESQAFIACGRSSTSVAIPSLRVNSSVS